MKKLFGFIIAFSFMGVLIGQTITSEYIRKIPALPKDSCNISRSGAEEFTIKVNNLIDQVEKNLTTLKNKADKYASDNEPAAKEAALRQMSQQYGMSDEDLSKVKNAKNLSTAEKKALNNKMLMQQANISMDEIEKLSNMSDQGQKAYFEAYATEGMANAKNNQKQQFGPNNAAVNYQLLSAQQAIMAKMTANNQEIGNFYAAAESDASGQEMLNRIETWHKKYISMSGIDYGQGKKMDSLATLIKNEQIKYCQNFTPKYRAALRQHLIFLKSSLPDYQKLGDITAEITKAQTGISPPPESSEIGSLEALQGYLGKLKDAFKFTLYYSR